MPRGSVRISSRVARLESIINGLQPRVDTLFQQNENLLNNPWVPQGSWAASTNTPTLANSDSADAGSSYLVADAGTVDFGAGGITFAGGDLVSKNAAGVWFKSAGIGSVLAGVPTVADARDTLSVYSKDEINDRINARQAANGVYLNGDDAYLAIADNDLFSFGDGTNDKPFTMIVWTTPDDVTGFEIISRDQSGGAEEWNWLINNSGKQIIELHDDSAGIAINRAEDVASAVNGKAQCFGVSYDGSGGANAADGITLYNDEGVVASTATNNASYVAMENLAQETRIGRRDSNYSQGKIHGVLIFNRQLSAAEIAEIMATPIVEVADQWGSDTERLTDGGFENWTGSTLDDWTEGSSITLAEETTDVQEGSSAADLTPGGGQSSSTNNALRQDSVVPVDQSVRIKFRVKNVSAGTLEFGPDFRHCATWDGTTLTETESELQTTWGAAEVLASSAKSLGSSWYEITVDFRLNSSGSDVSFRFAGSGQWLIDSTSLIDVGCVAAYLPENIESDGDWSDASSNNLNATGTSTSSLHNPRSLSLNTTGRAEDDVLIDVDNFEVETGGDVKVRQLRAGLSEALTISTGAITVTGSTATVDTEGAAGTDDLDTINGGEANALLVIRAANDSRTVVCKDGTGNLSLSGDFSLTHTHDRIVLVYDNALSLWVEVSRSDNNT